MEMYQFLLAYLLIFQFPEATANISLPGCKNKCGQVEVPYPYGINKGCYLNETFQVICNKSTHSAYVPWLEAEIDAISVSDHLVRVTVDNSFFVMAFNKSGESPYGHSFYFYANDDHFSVSTSRNKFVAVGCDFYAYMVDNEKMKFLGGCASLCNRTDIAPSVRSSCSGIHCCQTNFPESIENVTIWVETMNTETRSWSNDKCGYFGIMDRDYFGSFNASKFSGCNVTYRTPMILEWAVGSSRCPDARKRKDYACGQNTDCINSSWGAGYQCTCLHGYKGNPYILDGCKDIDECKSAKGNKCPRGSHCKNTSGSYLCVPNKKHMLTLLIVLGNGLAVAFLVILATCFWIYRRYKKIKQRKLKLKFFKRNGGLLLQQQISSSSSSVVVESQIFKIEELDKATNNFSENRVLGKGGLGTVYKGMLSDGSIVAIKIANVVDESQVGQFINEVFILSEINHRHIIKLLGCCLETQVPWLVYEYVCNGTLHEHLHEAASKNYSVISWENRVRIAAEVAGALAYLHSYASTMIIHRDIKSSNILLDENYRAVVSDFGLSRSVSIDKTHLTTAVGGTFGYLDPEYFRTGQLNEKSDVYAFGVVLAELLTGRKPVSSVGDEGLVLRFQNALKENRLFEIVDKIVADEGQGEEIHAFAELCKRCLKLNSRKRPCMKDVAGELDLIRKGSEHVVRREESFSNSPSERCYSQATIYSDDDDELILSYTSS